MQIREQKRSENFEQLLVTSANNTPDATKKELASSDTSLESLASAFTNDDDSALASQQVALNNLETEFELKPSIDVNGLEVKQTLQSANATLDHIESKQNQQTIYKATDALALIQSGCGLVKMVESKEEDMQHWNFLIDQLLYPQLYRPVHNLEEKSDRTTIYNTETSQWTKREITHPRGIFKETEYTKKTATTLLTEDGYHTLFNPNGVNVGILMDINLCKIPAHASGKPKYAFYTNAGTNSRWWIKGNQDKPSVVQTHTIEEIKKFNSDARKKKVVPTHNEIMAKLHRNAIRGIFTTKNTVTDRINALYIKLIFRETLNIDLPLLMITSNSSPVEYTQDQWCADLIAALKRDRNNPGHKLACKTLFGINLYYPSLFQKIYAATNQFTTCTSKTILWIKSLEYIKTEEDVQQYFKINATKQIHVLEWLIRKNCNANKKMLAAFAKSQLKLLEDKPEELLISAVSNRNFLALEYYLQSDTKFNKKDLGKVFHLLNLYKQIHLIQLMLQKYHPELDISCEKTTLADKPSYEFLTDEQIKYDCSQKQLNGLLNKLAFESNYEMFKKIICLRSDIPSKDYLETEISPIFRKNLLHYLLDDEKPQLGLIMSVCERLPSLITKADADGETAFSLIAKKNMDLTFLYFLKLITRHPELIKELHSNLSRTLYYLINNKRQDLAHQLLELKIDNPIQHYQHPETGDTTLHMLIAQEKPDIDFIQKICLLSNNALENKSETSPILLAAKNNLKIFALFCSRNEIMKIFTQEQMHKCLLFLMSTNNIAAVRQLLPHMHDHNQELIADKELGNNALHYALINRVQALPLIRSLSRFRNSAKENNAKLSPLLLAARVGLMNVFVFLSNQKTMMIEYTPQQLQEIVLALVISKQYEYATLLIDKIQVSSKEELNKHAWLEMLADTIPWATNHATGNTVLHYAVLDEKPNYHFIQKLHTDSFLFTQENFKNETPLLIAAKHNKKEILNILLMQVSLIKKLNHSQCAGILFYLIYHNHINTALQLLTINPECAQECCFSYWDEMGNSALHLLLKTIKPEFKLVSQLLHSSVISRENKEGDTPLTIAAKFNPEIIGYALAQENLMEQLNEAQLKKIILILAQTQQIDLIKAIIKKSPITLTKEECRSYLSNVLTKLSNSIQRESKSDVANNSLSVELLALLCSNDNLDIHTENSQDNNLLELAIQNRHDHLAFHIANNCLNQLSSAQLKKTCDLILTLKEKNYHSASPQILVLILNKAVNSLDQSTIEKCFSYLSTLKGHKINTNFLANLAGSDKQKCNQAISHMKYLIDLAKHPDNVIDLLADFAKNKPALAFMYPEKIGFFETQPRIQIINMAKEKLLQLMQKNKSFQTHQEALNLIYLEVENWQQYVDRLKALTATFNPRSLTDKLKL